MGLISKFQNAVSGSKAIDAVQSAGDWISSAKSTVQGWAGTAYTVASNGSTFVGMNYNAVPTIRDAIRAYVKNIQTVADGLKTDAEASQAVHGDIVKSTQDYLAAIKEITDSYVSTLLVYSDKMQEYYEAYAKSDTSLASSVGDEARSLTSNATTQKYTEQK